MVLMAAMVMAVLVMVTLKLMVTVTIIHSFTRRKGILALRLLGRRLTPVSEDTARLAPKSIADGHPASRPAGPLSRGRK